MNENIVEQYKLNQVYVNGIIFFLLGFWPWFDGISTLSGQHVLLDLSTSTGSTVILPVLYTR